MSASETVKESERSTDAPPFKAVCRRTAAAALLYDGSVAVDGAAVAAACSERGHEDLKVPTAQTVAHSEQDHKTHSALQPPSTCSSPQDTQTAAHSGSAVIQSIVMFEFEDENPAAALSIEDAKYVKLFWEPKTEGVTASGAASAGETAIVRATQREVPAQRAEQTGRSNRPRKAPRFRYSPEQLADLNELAKKVCRGELRAAAAARVFRRIHRISLQRQATIANDIEELCSLLRGE